jgi:hypothetical protein
MANEERTAELEALRRYWKEQIQNWQQSGLSQSEFCRRHNLKLHRFVYWRKRFLRPAAPICPPGIVELPFAIGAGLVNEPLKPVRVAFSSRNYRIEVERDFDPIALRQLIHVLDQMQC